MREQSGKKQLTVYLLLIGTHTRAVSRSHDQCWDTHKHSFTHLLLGLSEGVEVGQHGVSVVFVLLPEVDSRLSGEDVLHTLSGCLPHLNAGRQPQNATNINSECSRIHSKVRQGFDLSLTVPLVSERVVHAVEDDENTLILSSDEERHGLFVQGVSAMKQGDGREIHRTQLSQTAACCL